jgi:hypothetical protein
MGAAAVAVALVDDTKLHRAWCSEITLRRGQTFSVGTPEREKTMKRDKARIIVTMFAIASAICGICQAETFRLSSTLPAAFSVCFWALLWVALRGSFYGQGLSWLAAELRLVAVFVATAFASAVFGTIVSLTPIHVLGSFVWRGGGIVVPIAAIAALVGIERCLDKFHLRSDAELLTITDGSW